MSTGKIIAIVVVALLLLGVGGAYVWSQTQGAELRAKGQAVMAEAAAFGQATDNQGCVDESLERYVGCEGGFTCKIMSNIFFLRCLESSAPVAGFCDDVPSINSFMDAVGWRVDQCEEHGIIGDPTCANFFGQVEEYCDSLGGEPSG